MTKKDKVPRPSMSKARRARIFEKENGVCYICGKKVQANEPWDAEHVKAWELFHDDSDENLRVAHKLVCHKEKTDSDLRIMRKADKQGMRIGQQARRMKNGPQIKSRNEWPKGQKIKSRGFQKPWEKT